MEHPGQGAGRAPAVELARSPEFRRLVARRWTVSLVLLGLLLAAYGGFIALVAFAPGLLAARLDGATTLGVALATGVIGLAVLLTSAYVAWANGRWDAEVARLRRRRRPGAGAP